MLLFWYGNGLPNSDGWSTLKTGYSIYSTCAKCIQIREAVYFNIPELYAYIYVCMCVCIYVIYLYVNKFVHQIPSWQLQLRSANQEIPLNLCKPTVRYRVHNSRLLVPIMNDINLYHIYPSPIFQLCLTLLRYHGVYVTPVLFDSRFCLNCREY